jgi:hypothetical protein
VWVDKSGNDYNAIAKGTPVITTNVLNSLPGITVNNTGSGDMTYASSIPIRTFINGLSVFAVYKSLGSNTSQNILFFRGTTSFPNNNVSNPFSTEYNKIMVGTNSSVQYTPGSPIYNTSPSVMFINMDQINSLVSQTVNGTSYIPTISSGTAPWTASDNGTAFFLGNRGDNTSSVNAMYHEVLVFNTNLSVPQRQKVEGYLAWKWGLQASLPADHPYLSNTLLSGWNTILGGSRVQGASTYSATLSTSITNTTGGTAMYEVGPIITTASSRLLITANLSFVASSANSIQLTVGRFTSTGATASQSTNIASNTLGITIPYTTGSAYFMAAKTTVSGNSVNVCGTATDAPGPGKYFYRIWASSVPAMSANTTLTANLSVLQM